MTQTNATPELASSALSHISANCGRDTWAKTAMAIKSQFPDEIGFELFDTWSQSGDDYNPMDTKATWRSVKSGGGVGIGTLFHLAKENGFIMPKSGPIQVGQASQVAIRPTSKPKAQQSAEKAREEAAHKEAAEQAETLWGASSEVIDSNAAPYLLRKRVQPYGVRFADGNWLLVPLRDAAGVLWNVQRIAPVKPSRGSDKLFLKGGRKSGLWHMCGDPNGAAVLLMAEGYATAATVHEATGRPAVVAFDAGNLAHVAKALRAQHPNALLVICGDDDVATFEAKGHNPGRDKAMAVAKAVQGLAVFPDQLPEGGSDFNDMYQHRGGATGLEAVRLLVEAAINAHHASQTTAQVGQVDKVGKGRTKPPRDASEADSDTSRVFDVFDVSGDGVWHNGIDQDGKRKPPEWVCSRLNVEALTRDQDGGGWGYLLTFDDPLGNPKQWAMPARMLSGDGGEYRATLLNMGLRIASTPRARNLLTQYIQTRKPEEFASCTDRVGWHPGGAFVLPRETIGGSGERIVFQSESPIENTFLSKGTPDQWRDRVGALCVGNPRLAFAVACAFAGPLFRPAGREGGGFHLRGKSTCGKSTAQEVAASIYGGPSFKRSWKATDNALEGIALQHNDCLLILDEIGEVDGRLIGDVVYMLSNGQGKARSTRSAMPKPIARWRTVFLSTGEKSLSDHMAEGQKRTRAGQEVRMADIPADAGKGHGLFENLHGFEGGNNFSKHLKNETESAHGSTGRAWFEYLTERAGALRRDIREASASLFIKMIPANASGQVERIGERFSLVGAAGEMATAAGLTGWPVGESERAAIICFNAWLSARGGNGDGEVVEMLRQVRRFLEAHGEGRFAMWHRGADDHAPKTLNKAGVRRMLGDDGQPIKTNSQHGTEFGDRMPAAIGEGVSFEYFVLTETFRTEICQGFDYQAVCRVLLEHDCLAPDKGRSFDCKARLPGIGPATCYRIKPAIFDLDL